MRADEHPHRRAEARFFLRSQDRSLSRGPGATVARLIRPLIDAFSGCLRRFAAYTPGFDVAAADPSRMSRGARGE
jgi:hypothetical protein